MPGYCFYCHKQIQVEIMRHNIAGAPEWFQSKIESKSICMYDDEMILDELSGVYGEWAISAYAGMLKTACDGKVKAKTGDTTDATVYADWYKSVYLPAADPASLQASDSGKSVVNAAGNGKALS